MIIREAPEGTLKDVRESLEAVKVKTLTTKNDEIGLDLTGDRVFRLSEKVSVPATHEGVKAFGAWLDVPTKFLERIEADMQQYVLTNLLQRAGGEAHVIYTSDGIQMVRDPGLKLIPPVKLVEVAERVIDPVAPVRDFWVNGEEFRLDVFVPEDFDRGIGGDRKVGDLTRGGIRIFQNVKNNLAPTVSEFLYRLVCTNGMEVVDERLKVDARGASVEEVLAEFEIMADRAFRRVEGTIESFYEMRDQPLDNPERTIFRIADEQGLPNRTATNLAQTAPTMGDDPTMFDLVNLITNQANDPALRAGVARNLQRTGGRVVMNHADRCSHCQAKLN